MTHEEDIARELTERFGLGPDTIRVAGARRLFLTTPYAAFRGVLEHAVQAQQFRRLCTITGLDEGETLAFIYHLARPDGIVLNLKTAVPKAAPVLRTVSDLFPGGVIYERELEDLLGARVEGLPPGNRYPLPDNWPAGQYPLRKEWKASMLDGGAPQGEEGQPWLT